MNYTEIKVGLSVRCDKYNIKKGLLLGKVDHSYTKVEVMDDDKGRGWNERTQSYKGYFVNGGGPATDTWSRGQNHGFGQKYIIHIKDLTIN